MNIIAVMVMLSPLLAEIPKIRTNLLARIREEVEKRKESGLDEVTFERSRKKKIGNFLRMMNSPESIANEFTKYRFKDIDLFDILPVYEQITLRRC